MPSWLWALLLDQDSSESPTCPHEFTSVTGHPPRARITASLHGPKAGSDAGPPVLCLAAWQAVTWHPIKVHREWLWREMGRRWRSKGNSWLSTADFGQCEGVKTAGEKWPLAPGHVLDDCRCATVQHLFFTTTTECLRQTSFSLIFPEILASQSVSVFYIASDVPPVFSLSEHEASSLPVT